MTGRHGKIEGIYRDHGQRLWRALYGFSRDPELASDAVAEAFAQALRRETELREPLNWIWKAAFRIAAGQLQERGRHNALSADPSGDRSYEMAEPPWDLLRALSQLSARQRAAVVLHYYGGVTVRETAAALGSTPGAVRVHLYRARKHLRELLEAEVG